MSAVSITRAAAASLFVKLGAFTAYTWNVSRLESEINKYYPEYNSERHSLEGDERATDAVVRAARSVQARVTVLDGPEPKGPERRTGGARNFRMGRPSRSTPYAARQYSWKINPVRRIANRSGVMNTVIRELERATGEKPVTKEYLLKILKAEFPDRDPKGMSTNLNNLIPTRLREHYAITVRKRRLPDADGRRVYGYWIDPADKTACR